MDVVRSAVMYWRKAVAKSDREAERHLSRAERARLVSLREHAVAVLDAAESLRDKHGARRAADLISAAAFDYGTAVVHALRRSGR
ncbi:hypothetical protein ATK36_0470 [Amycolatopsis sulphurea]|uniref:Uncharacterized protein n=1 Tax=Amycolatopsis sulphurea TaxID=76022 RepID=A0A2A9FZT2_9PSEU|nr:hypothetical protein [Amycolatopsis sulphurea]PFG56934.1 hypothetical protein ATK36_0470 [Amycolatopsis sulphurea]